MPPVVESRKPVTAPPVAHHRLSPEGILEARKPLDSMVEKNTAHLFSLQTQLGAYLILGNGIALFTLSQAIVQGNLEPTPWSEAVYLRFMWGLAVAFAAMAATYFFGLFGSYVLGAMSQLYLMIADADKKMATTTDPLAKQAAAGALVANSQALENHQRNIPTMIIWMAVVIAIYVASGVLFVWGLAGALHLTTH